MKMAISTNHLKLKVTELMRKCQLMLNCDPENDVLQSSYSKLFQLNHKQPNEPFSTFEFQDIIKISLDLTFLEENELVDEEFRIDDAEIKLFAIVDTLDNLEQLCQTYFGNDVVHVLGIDMAECLHWRKGALFYMYCHTKYSDKEWLKENQTKFCTFLYRGITYLNSMLSLRQPIMKEEIWWYSDMDIVTLLEKGIFSDCHMLALMYAGEMCYWYIMNTTVSGELLLSVDNARKMGKNFLELYSSAINGPLKDKGWNADKAKQLLGYFT